LLWKKLVEQMIAEKVWKFCDDGNACNANGNCVADMCKEKVVMMVISCLLIVAML